MPSSLQSQLMLTSLVSGRHKSEPPEPPLRLAASASLLACADLALDEITLRQANLITDLGIWAVKLVDGQDIYDCRTNWSESMYGMMGHTPETLPAPRVSDFFLCLHEGDRQPLMDVVLAAVAAKQPWQMEYRLPQPDGSERAVIEIGQALYDEAGKAHTLLGTLRDVTGCRRASAELRNSASRLQLALEGAGAGSYEWKVDTGETIWSV